MVSYRPIFFCIESNRIVSAARSIVRSLPMSDTVIGLTLTDTEDLPIFLAISYKPQCSTVFVVVAAPVRYAKTQHAVFVAVWQQIDNNCKVIQIVMYSVVMSRCIDVI